ncbi:hypothetical protein [Croceiramulus getboli]|nr:hypothetical protein P8624_14045 [Flavobacteriaceae bacterium YJPT1-3]
MSTQDRLFSWFLSEKTKKRVERVILGIALFSFVFHLILIYLKDFGWIDFLGQEEFFTNPITAIYTPFSFILVYEVYLLIFYLPKSFTNYITKQYEIITLIIIRKLFYDLSVLELTSDWFAIKEDLQFTYDLIASMLLFYLIFLFEKLGRLSGQKKEKDQVAVQNFIQKKKWIAIVLVPLFFGMALYTLIDWASAISFYPMAFPDIDSINRLFYDEFFTVLILVDVVLLLISFFYTHDFHKIIRNSGFIVSTILIRISFGVSGLVSSMLVVAAVLFGVLIIFIHNRYEKNKLVEIQ